jgi:hypothetical protein
LPGVLTGLRLFLTGEQMKYLKHKEKQFLIPYTTSMETSEWEVIEEPLPEQEEAPVRKKPGPKPKVQQPE